MAGFAVCCFCGSGIQPGGGALCRRKERDMIKAILWDVDGTLLSFKKAERAAMQSCFDSYGLGQCTEEQLRRYSVLNLDYWKRLERGEITKERLLVERFEKFFAAEGLPCADPAGFNAEYQLRLGDTICFNDDSYRLVESLRGRVGQYAVTNGTRVAQDRKLRRSGLDKLFDGIFISDAVGCEKPGLAFFDYVFAHIPPWGKEEILIVGDSLTSDIRGGNNAGIRTGWYNPDGEENTAGVHVDYELRDLREVLKLVERA